MIENAVKEAVSAKTANKNSCARASFILTQMPARGEAESDESR